MDTTAISMTTLSGDGYEGYFRSLRALADQGHVSAVRQLLALVHGAVQENKPELTPELRKFLAECLRRLLEDQSDRALRQFVKPRCARRSETRPVRRPESRPPEGRSFYVVLTSATAI